MNITDDNLKPLIVSLEGQSWVESPVEFTYEEFIEGFKNKEGDSLIVWGDSLLMGTSLKSECSVFKGMVIHAVLFPDDVEVRIYKNKYNISKYLKNSYKDIKNSLR